MTGPKFEMAEMEAEKRALRISCAAQRGQLCPADRSAASARLADIGLGFAALPRGVVVSAYSAMGSEIDPAPLIERLVATHVRTCLPVIQPMGNPLKFRTWQPGQALVARTWGILEPAEDAPEIDPDVLLVPLLAFDRSGMRLGYGGGYYDRTLQRLRTLKPITAIGLAYATQELPAVPSGPYDQPLDWVLTNAGPFEIGPFQEGRSKASGG